jgi:hypothetical protein
MSTVLPPVPVGRRRHPVRTLVVSFLLLAAAGACAVWAVVVASSQPVALLRNSPGRAGPRPGSGRGTEPSGATGSYVPAADLVSDPVFVTLRVGFALETTETNSLTVERLARSDDGGRSWYVTGSPFPVAGDFSTLQFISARQGYVFGPSGLLVTSDGGAHWSQVVTLDGTLQRAIPIGRNVWATFTKCGPPGLAASCAVGAAISLDGGLRWHDVTDPPIAEAPGPAGGDILARYSLNAAYVVSYGPTGGGLAFTDDDGATWRRLSDPCSGPWADVDLAAPGPGDLWLVCGAIAPRTSGVQAKVAYRSDDGGRSWVLMASSGFAPGAAEPVGDLPLSGRVSQLATISAQRAWLGVAGLGVMVTFDSGRDWQLASGFPAATSPSPAVGVTFNNVVDGWAIEIRHGVWRTSDAVHWRLVDGS